MIKEDGNIITSMRIQEQIDTSCLSFPSCMHAYVKFSSFPMQHKEELWRSVSEGKNCSANLSSCWLRKTGCKELWTVYSQLFERKLTYIFKSVGQEGPSPPPRYPRTFSRDPEKGYRTPSTPPKIWNIMEQKSANWNHSDAIDTSFNCTYVDPRSLPIISLSIHKIEYIMLWL